VQGDLRLSLTFTYHGRPRLFFYEILDQIGLLIPRIVTPVAEAWTTGPSIDYPGQIRGWMQTAPGTDGTTLIQEPQEFQGNIEGAQLGRGNFDSIPEPDCSFLMGDMPVIGWSQEWRVGSSTPGLGQRVQTDKIVKYVGFAVVNTVRTPVP
jgi:hypothetical protein